MSIMGLYESHDACGSYDPDYARSESMCYGMGYTPPCKDCGRDEAAHYFTRSLGEIHRSIRGESDGE